MTKSFYAGIVALAFIISTAFAVDNFYERRVSAESQFERLAADQEAARLDTERQLIELELKTLEAKDQKTPADLSRIEYLKARRMLIEQRLLSASKAKA